MVRKVSLSGMINQANWLLPTNKFSMPFSARVADAFFPTTSNREPSRVKAGSQEAIAVIHASKSCSGPVTIFTALIAALEPSFFGSSPSVDQFNLVRSIASIEQQAPVDS